MFAAIFPELKLMFSNRKAAELYAHGLWQNILLYTS
jgi:hypothetical protein